MQQRGAFQQPSFIGTVAMKRDQSVEEGQRQTSDLPGMLRLGLMAIEEDPGLGRQWVGSGTHAQKVPWNPSRVPLSLPDCDPMLLRFRRGHFVPILGGHGNT
jgi:hypothetical protein